MNAGLVSSGLSGLLHFRRPPLFAQIAVLAFWWAGCWIAADDYWKRRLDDAYREEVARADGEAASLVEGFDRIIHVRLGMMSVLARDAGLREVLRHSVPQTTGASRPNPDGERRRTPDRVLAAANDRLRMDAVDIRMTEIALYDTALNAVATSAAGTDGSHVGAGYAGYGHIEAMRNGHRGYRVTAGKPNGSAAFLFHAPIMDGDRLLGTVVARTNLAAFGNWFVATDGFLTDKNGVVVYSPDPALVLRALPDAPVFRLGADERAATYGQTAFETIQVAPWGDARFPELHRLTGRTQPVVHRSLTTSRGSEPVIHVLPSFPQIDEFEAARTRAALAAGFGGTLALLFGCAVAGRRRERREHIQALAQSEQEFRNLAESSPDFIIRYDVDHRIRYMNSGLAHYLDIAAADAVGRRPIDLWPDGRFVAIDDAAEMAVATGNPQVVELKGAPDSGYFPVAQIIVVPERNRDGDIVGTLAFGRDISAIRDTESRLVDANLRMTATLQAIPDLLFELDRDGVFLDIHAPDPAALAAPKEQLLGRKVADMLAPEAARVVMEALSDAGIQGKSYGRLMHLDLGTKKRWFELAVARKPGAEGAEPTFVALSRDVTVREAALADARRLADTRGEFLSQMSHELRTPLTGILGHIQLLQGDGNAGPGNAATISAIRQSGEELLTLIDDFLDLARIEAGTLTLHPERIPLASFARDVSTVGERRALRHGLAFTCTLAPDLPRAIHADARRLRQLLLHLISNAVKFTERGEVELRIERSAPASLRIAVRDTGIGIAADDIDRIFRAFERLGEFHSRPSGSGLGLTIAQRLAQSMGGRLRVDSRPGAGSLFWFDLPQPPEIFAGSAAVHISANDADESFAPDEVPPRETLLVLHEIAQRGSMRDIVREADRIAASESRQQRFAERLRQLAAEFQSKAIVVFIETQLERADAPPGGGAT